MRTNHENLWLKLVAAWSIVACSCAAQSVPPAGKPKTTPRPRLDDPREVLGPGRKADTPKEAAGRWSIVLAVAAADAPEVQVVQLLAKAKAAGVPEAYVERRGKSMVVAAGSFAHGTDADAKAELARIQAIEHEGGRPFERAILAPPPFEGLPGSLPEFDLANVKRERPKAMYTLQVAVYQPPEKGDKPPGEADMKVVRAAAEKAAVELRREGEEAFYYHGPRRSMVTLGVFTVKDFDAAAGREGMAIQVLRAKYPYNLVNGATLKVRTRGQTEAKEQPSFVVAIP